MADLVVIPPEALPDYWRKVEPFIELACAGSSGKFKAEDIVRALVKRDFQLWVALGEDGFDAAMLTRLMEFPRAKTCEMLAVTGRQREGWVHHISAIENWAAHNGCSLMQTIARPGWERVLAPYGYEKTHILAEKKI